VFSLSIAESSGDSESRDFQDGVTFALTTTTPNKRRILTATLTITQGTPGATPTPVSVAGAYIIGLVLVNDTAIEKVHDCTQPFGMNFTALSTPLRDFVPISAGFAEDTVIPGGISAAGTGSCILVPPMFPGDPSAKLLGVELKYTLALSGSALIKVVQYETGVSTPTVLDDISALFTTGATQTVKVDLRGYPLFLSAARGPYWASGDRFKRGQLFGQGKTLALHIFSGAAGNAIFWAKWFFAKG
jgi:hypothetical protein